MKRWREFPEERAALDGSPARVDTGIGLGWSLIQLREEREVECGGKENWRVKEMEKDMVSEN